MSSPFCAPSPARSPRRPRCGLTPAFPHAVCGDRIFPATLAIDDPGVGDELALPTVTLDPDKSLYGARRAGRDLQLDKDDHAEPRTVGELRRQPGSIPGGYGWARSTPS